MVLPVVGPLQTHSTSQIKGLDLEPIDKLPNCCLSILTSTTRLTPDLYNI